MPLEDMSLFLTDSVPPQTVCVRHHNGTGKYRTLCHRIHGRWNRLPEWKKPCICSYHYRYSCGLCSQSGWSHIHSRFWHCSWHPGSFPGSFRRMFLQNFLHCHPWRWFPLWNKAYLRCKHRLLRNILRLSCFLPPDFVCLILQTFAVVQQTVFHEGTKPLQQS